MPAYDYQCDACGHEFEVTHGMTALRPKTCPQCKKRKLRKVLAKPPAYHSHYSPMHPRVNRGRGY
jgi:putative FmdB family regulatory protein